MDLNQSSKPTFLKVYEERNLNSHVSYVAVDKIRSAWTTGPKGWVKVHAVGSDHTYYVKQEDFEKAVNII